MALIATGAWVDSMQLIKINPLQTQPAQASFEGWISGTAAFRFRPIGRARSLETALCGDHQVDRIGMQSLGYDFFTHAWTIGGRSIDEIDSQFYSPAQDA